MLDPGSDREAFSRAASLFSSQDHQRMDICRFTSIPRGTSAHGRLHNHTPVLQWTERLGSVVFPGPPDITNHDSSKGKHPLKTHGS